MRDAARTPRGRSTGKVGITGGAIALLAGAVLALCLPWPLPAWSCWAIGALAFAAGAATLAHLHGAWRRLLAIAAIASVGFAIAGWHATTAMALRLPVALEGAEVALRGRILELPVGEPRRVRFLLRVDDDPSQLPALRGRLLRLSWYHGAHAVPRVRAGSRWQLHARLRAPRGLRNPGWFDSERHALAQRLTATGYVRNVAGARELQTAQGLDAWRESMSGQIEAGTAAPASRFVRALALGDIRGLSESDWNTLRATGLTHLIAISGFHVGLVAGFVALLA